MLIYKLLQNISVRYVRWMLEPQTQLELEGVAAEVARRDAAKLSDDIGKISDHVYKPFSPSF
ncbi:hypothetical protein Hypma_006525 [Hypsizygus marmoreus]|uniref:Uncharacterized protein n=1 Tax=Hypsizygus marmoreus TaxID=39966 RepID=A0A369JYD4_HYPMA|nr:hypothetical protein Hypma_006525 [Hypsizygus marmoreus]